MTMNYDDNSGRFGASTEAISAKLHEAIDRLQLDAQRVEILAAVMQGYAQPVATYEFEDYRLPPRRDGGRGEDF
jgi:hypothetical protein